MNSKLVLPSRVHSMVNLDETTLYTGMVYGAYDTRTDLGFAHNGHDFRISRGSLCAQQYHLDLQMNLERTTEMPSAVWWGSCCVSVVFDTKRSSHSLQWALSDTPGAFLPFMRVYFADYILEHSEDDTKSLFSIIKVSRHSHKKTEHIMKFKS